MSLHTDAITIARKLTLACSATVEAPLAKQKAITHDEVRHIEVEIVAIAQINGEACLVDAFFAPVSHDGRRYDHPYGDPTFLEGLKTALGERGFPADSLTYADRSAQDEHCVGFEGDKELASAVLKHMADTRAMAEAA
jgi:hypothetical protein